MNRTIMTLAALAAVALAWATSHRDPPPATAQAPLRSETPAAVAPATSPAQPRRAAGTPPPGPLPLSFRGTEIDGRLAVDAGNNLLITGELRQVFDYFLSAVGEEPLLRSVQRLRVHLDRQLPQPARQQAQALLTAYLDYKRQLLDLERAHPRADSLAAVRQRLDALQALRARLLDPQVHQAFFGLDEQYDRFSLERLAIRQDPRLDAKAKGEAIDRLQASLPEGLRQALAPQLQLELRQQSERLQAAGGSPEQLRQLRQQLVGNAATERLQALDARRAQWAQRIASYQAQKRQIEANRGLGEPDRRAAVERLAADRFDASERLRLEAAERLLGAREG